jgi:hypothetical protein
MRRDGPDIDHCPARLTDERQQRLSQSHGADRVDLELAADLLSRNRLERALDNDPGHIDKAG